MTKVPRNLGEQNEIFLKAFLLHVFSKKIPIIINGESVLINSLSFGPNINLPVWKDEYALLLENGDYLSLKKIFPKAPTSFKADLEINGVRYSVKYSNSARSAIVNHTNRKGFLRVCGHLGISIEKLDKIISEYWEKREKGEIMEDIINSNSSSPFANNKDCIAPLLEYFLFDGTGSKDSRFPADKVLVFSDPTNPSTYKIYSRQDVVNQIWDKLVFSVRSKKGMPNAYTKEKYPELDKWVRYRPGDNYPKGALHIRT